MALNPGQTNFIPGDILTASQYNLTNNTVDKLAIDDNSRIVFPSSNVPLGIADGHWVLAATPGTYVHFVGTVEVLTPSVFVYNIGTLTWTTYPLYYGATGEVDLINYSDYVFHKAGEDFVYYKNTTSLNISFTVPFIYKCIVNTVPGEGPESHPGKWERIGIYIDTQDVEDRLTALELNNQDLVDHLTDYANPHQVTKLQVGLSDVDNTADTVKPISIATQAALSNKADIVHTHPGITFASDIIVSLSSGKTFGKYTTGQTIPATGKTAEEVMRLVAIEELYPSLTNPDNSFSLSQAGLREIASTTSLDFTANFSRGTISPAYGTSGYRSGLPTTYTYTGTGLTNTSTPSLSDTKSVGSYTVLNGVQTWTNTVTHLIGEQPKTSAGNNYSTPYPAGTTSIKAVSITGVYPWFGTSASLTSLTKQPLALMNSTYVEITMVAEDGTNKQKAKFPVAWSIVTGIQFFNTNNNSWEWLNGNQVNSLTSFTQSVSTEVVQGSTINYTMFTHNGSTIGSRQLRFYTN